MGYTPNTDTLSLNSSSGRNEIPSLSSSSLLEIVSGEGKK